MPSITLPTATLIGAGVAGTGAVAGSLISGSAAKSAAAQQAGAANNAAALQESQYLQTRTDLQPYNVAGQSTLPALQAFPSATANILGNAAALAQANLPGQMTQAQLVQTPGYQFQLDQGMKALNNSAAYRGQGISGSAVKAALGYGTGLASTTYQTQFANQQQQYLDYVQNFQNLSAGNAQVYGQLSNLANLGENAAAKSGAIGQAGAAAAGSNIAAAGQALAAGTAAAGNAYGGALNNLGNTGSNALSNYALSPYLLQLLNGGSPTSESPTSSYTNPVNNTTYQSSANPNDNF